MAPRMLSKTRLGQAFGLGAAKGGTHHWIMQRVTALFALPLLALMVVVLVFCYTHSYRDSLRFLASPFVSVGLIFGIGVCAWHMRLGLQVVIEDYVHKPFWKIFALLLNLFWSVFVAILGIYGVLKIAMGV